MNPGPVAIIDIGSNSIKVLVAVRSAQGTVESLYSETIDARISAGISRARPRLSIEGQDRGVAAVSKLLAATKPYAPNAVALVATSAVRDAENGSEFRDRVRATTGHDIRILTGQEEANLIGRGLTCDPALRSLTDFYVFDLGGGSLECLSFRQRKIAQAISLPLGCVRLTEKFIPDPTGSLASSRIEDISRFITDAMGQAGFSFDLSAGAVAVATGGTIATARAILSHQENQSFAETPSLIPLDAFRRLLSELAVVPLEERKLIAGLPPGRADVFPAALATLIAVAELGRFSAYQHSLYNLRFGLADELLR
jgi:exopolyphosphatase/guanosine-5'-triphosphate,3'-diphosphate pyrophosphatase